MTGKNYEAPHPASLSILLLLPVPYVQAFPSQNIH